MKRALIGLVGAVLLTTPGCRRDGSAATSSAASDAPAPLPSPAPELARRISLHLGANPSVGVGDALDLRIEFHNDSDAEVTLVRPLYGSWELAREPEYRLEWTDESGQVIVDPLGFAPGLDCGTFGLVEEDDLVRLPAGGTTPVHGATDARPRHDVLASARPGRYSLRLHYSAHDVGGATPLRLRSEPVPVTITGGNAATWACRAEQLIERDDHEYATVGPGTLLPVADGTWWLVYGRYVHRVRAGEKDPRGDVWVRHLGPTLAPLGDATRVRESDDEVGWVSATMVADGLVIVTSPGNVGGRRLEAFPVALGATPKAGEPHVLQAAPGNPYVTRLVSTGSHALVFHNGDERNAYTLMLSRVDATASPMGDPKPLGEGVLDFELVADGTGPMIAWLQRDSWEGGMAQRLDTEGRASGAPIRFVLEPAHSLLSSWVTAGELHVAYADRSTRGDDPADVMGMYVQRYASDGTAVGSPRALSPEAKWATAFGDIAWRDGRLARLFFEGDRLLAGPAKGRTGLLSTTATGDPNIEAYAGGYVARWSDVRDDDSAACQRLKECSPELYGAVLDPNGALRGTPVRLTHEARAKPFVPSSHDWARHCTGR